MKAGDATRAHILVVDDHAPNLVALQGVLEPLGHPVVQARSGPEALRRLLERDFACILLDVQMPGMDGFETAELIRTRERTRSTPILFLTALSHEPQHVVRGYGAGAVDYIVKPFDPDILRAKVGVFVDLYLRERRVRALEVAHATREREERLAFVARVAGVGHWSLDLASDRLEASDGCKANLGLPPEAELSSFAQVLALAHPEDRAALQAARDRAAADGGDLAVEFRVQPPGGAAPRWVAVRGRAVPGSDGGVAGLAGVTLDIGAQKAQEAERERLLAETREALRLRDEFLSVASHELKTPLTPLTLKLEALDRLVTHGPAELLAQRLPAGVQAMRRQVQRLAELVNTLLDVSRISTGHLTLSLAPVDLGALVADVAQRFEPVAARARSPLQLELAPGAVGRWDALRLEQVLANLLSNALKYGAGRPVLLRVERDAAAGRARLQVRDAGIGIDAEALQRIFDKFERAVSERHYGGLGLGLYVTRQLVEAMGGTVRAESRPGEGATFTVELPLA